MSFDDTYSTFFFSLVIPVTTRSRNITSVLARWVVNRSLNVNRILRLLHGRHRPNYDYIVFVRVVFDSVGRRRSGRRMCTTRPHAFTANKKKNNNKTQINNNIETIVHVCRIISSTFSSYTSAAILEKKYRDRCYTC